MTTPFFCAATAAARPDLPLAVGPPMTRTVCFSARLNRCPSLLQLDGDEAAVFLAADEEQHGAAFRRDRRVDLLLHVAGGGDGLLVDFDARPALQAVAARWGERIGYVSGEVDDRLGLGAVLVRPDGFVAWAGDGAPDIDAVSSAARRWFGAPVEN